MKILSCSVEPAANKTFTLTGFDGGILPKFTDIFYYHVALVVDDYLGRASGSAHAVIAELYDMQESSKTISARVWKDGSNVKKLYTRANAADSSYYTYSEDTLYHFWFRGSSDMNQLESWILDASNTTLLTKGWSSLTIDNHTYTPRIIVYNQSKMRCEVTLLAWKAWHAISPVTVTSMEDLLDVPFDYAPLNSNLLEFDLLKKLDAGEYSVS